MFFKIKRCKMPAIWTGCSLACDASARVGVVLLRLRSLEGLYRKGFGGAKMACPNPFDSRLSSRDMMKEEGGRSDDEDNREHGGRERD